MPREQAVYPWRTLQRGMLLCTKLITVAPKCCHHTKSQIKGANQNNGTTTQGLQSLTTR